MSENKGKQGRNTKKSQEEILRAARSHFVKKGYEAASIREIAASAGCTTSLVFHHFKSKELLWERVKTSIYEEYAASQSINLSKDAEFNDIVKAGIQIKFDFLKQNPDTTSILLWLMASQDRSNPEIRKRLGQKAIMLFEKGQQMGKCRKDVTASNLFFMVIALIEHWFESRYILKDLLEDPPPLDEFDQRYNADLLKVFMDGIKPK